MEDRTYTLDEVIMLIKAFHLDTQEGIYSKELLDWCNKWIEDNNILGCYEVSCYVIFSHCD